MESIFAKATIDEEGKRSLRYDRHAVTYTQGYSGTARLRQWTALFLLGAPTLVDSFTPTGEQDKVIKNFGFLQIQKLLIAYKYI